MKLSRRSFIAGAATAGAATLVGMVGCSTPDRTSSGATSDVRVIAETVHEPISTESFDVVVVGSGTAGTAATLAAVEAGLSVVCLEKNSGLCGTSAFAEGFCGVNSKFQAEQNIKIDANAVVADTMDYHHYGCLGPVVRAMIDASGATIDWLTDKGITWATVTSLGESYQVWHLPAGEDGGATHVGDVLTVLQQAAEIAGAEFRTSTPMTGLAVSDEGSVTGVYAQGQGGEVQFDAKAVILATGGYANNGEMFENFTHKPYDSVHVWGMTGRDGDGISFAMEQAGAQVHHPEAVMWHTGMLEGTDAFSDIPNYIVTMQPTMRVNETGKRYFNEAETSNFTGVGNALTSNAQNFAIFDDAFIDHIESEGPWMPIPNLGAFAGQPYECRNGLLECEGLVQANTIEELADALGLDPDTLSETVVRFNRFCEAGQDDDFGLPENMLLPVSTAPFYGAKITPTLFTTVGGLRINQNMQVMSTEGFPIEGLFAAGGDAAGYYGADYDVDVCSGSQQGWAATSGRLAAEYVAANL